MEFLRLKMEAMFLEKMGLRKKGGDIEPYVQNFLREPLSLDLGKVPKQDPTISRMIAEACMENKEYEKAIEFYTLGLQDSPPFSKLSMDFYIGRSKALVELGYYEESLLDVGRALEFPVPEQLRQALDERKVGVKSKMRNDKSAERKAQTRSCYEIPSLSHEESEDTPGCSSAISVIHDCEHGYHLVARKPIKLGDVLLIQKPLVTFPLPNHDDLLLCSNCLKYSTAPIPCDFCSFASFCSEECRGEAYKGYHKIECQFGTCSDCIKLTIRLFLKITDNGARLNETIQYCKKLDALDNDSSSNKHTSDKLIGNDIESVLNLSCPMQEDDKHESLIQAAASATMLRNYSSITHGINDVVGLAKLMYRLLYIVSNRNTEIRRPDSKDPEGLAIYPLLQLIYHSCCGNTIITKHENNVVVCRASKDIKPGDEITQNYVGPAVRLPTALRQDILKRRNNIVCKCLACMANYTFKPELRRKIDIPAQLKRRLRKCPTDIPSMWELLKLIDSDIKRPCLEIELLKIAIQRAYSQTESSDTWTLYNGLGIY